MVKTAAWFCSILFFKLIPTLIKAGITFYTLIMLSHPATRNGPTSIKLLGFFSNLDATVQ